MPVDTRQTVRRQPEARARTSNGSVLIHGDNRLVWARRCRDVMAEYVSDLGGPDMVTTAELSIIRRIATLTVELESLEASFAVEPATDKKLDLYQRTAGNLRRLIDAIGTKRRAKPVPDLADLIAGSSTR